MWIGMVTELDALHQRIFMNMELILTIIMALSLTAEVVDLVCLFITGHLTMAIQMSCYKLNKWKIPGEIQSEWKSNQV